MTKELLKPDYLFETSWEVCNKVGGIHTVLASKALSIVNIHKNNYILIGPDVWRDIHDNPAFIEDSQLFKSWREKAYEEGLRVRVGRWNIPGNPIAMIIDFTSFMSIKDEILSRFWETYKLDSLSGQWDYIEPVLFGYAAGRLIESFVRYNLSLSDKVVAQFHEWMTGAGILHLRQFVPQVATVFTTHATIVGRTLAGNNKPLYKNLEGYSTADTAKEFNITAKLSMEKLSAAHADSFTTVSELTSRECSHFLEKKVDILTPNGFDDAFLPHATEFDKIRQQSRERIRNVAESLLGYSLSNNTKYICNSGRYEFKNKGIDLFIDALGELNKNHQEQEIIALLLIPAHHHGPRKELEDKLRSSDKSRQIHGNSYLTHDLHEDESDPMLERIKNNHLLNRKEDAVKVIFVPAYLKGDDGILNLSYYEILMSMDMTAFPSYYEPWGYTPLESLIFKVPTITTTLAGFGLWVNKEVQDKGNAIRVIDRTDNNDSEVTNQLAGFIRDFLNLDEKSKEEAREKAFSISRIALWNNLVNQYFKAYNMALSQVENRFGLVEEKQYVETPQIRQGVINKPIWNKLNVQSKLPEKLKNLEEIAMNMWWSWNIEAQELFEDIDYKMWNECEHNPILLFGNVDYERIKELEKDEDFLFRLERVYKKFKSYMDNTLIKDPNKIAYFSMEFGLHSCLKIYSGGLGILAGDYLKEASDSNIPIVAVGLLYTYGYFKQQISIYGEQLAIDELQHFSHLPIKQLKDENGVPLEAKIGLPGRTLTIHIWEVNVGRIKLYLMDTNNPANTPQDRTITHHLYGGDWENRLKQEILLGIGGIRMLEVLGIKPEIYHCNEGHAAFISLERTRAMVMEEHLPFNEAKEVVKSTTLFTTHTPVPAGHDEFNEDLIRTYFAHYPERYKISWEEFMDLGKPEDHEGFHKFNMSHLASNLSQEINGVSLLHEYVTKDIFTNLYKGYLKEELHIGHVTNGVHFATWTSKEWLNLYKEEFGDDFLDNMLNRKIWNRIYKVPDSHIWSIKQESRVKLISKIKERFNDKWMKRHEDPKHIVKINETLNEKALTIGFARRFATYKRAHLLFKNLDRLSAIVNNPNRPIQFLFAGKAHPHDKAGQDILKNIVEISKRPEFIGKILFLQNYDMRLARTMVQGVDIWLNTPTRPLEASGTSGQKVVMNGGLHFSVLDGWWYEGYREEAGWALTEERSYNEQHLQDELDAETIYRMIESEILPLFYDRDEKGVPVKWVQYIKNSIANVCPDYTTRRMIMDYKHLYYDKLMERAELIKKDNYDLARKLSSWKKKIARSWESIEIASVELPGKGSNLFELGNIYPCSVTLDLNEINPEDIGVEIVIIDSNGKYLDREEFKKGDVSGSKVTYFAEICPKTPGELEYGIRIFPKNKDLAHRQDFSFVKWI